MRGRPALLFVLAAACGSPRSAHMYPAGDDKDDGYGELAQKSAHLLTNEGVDPVVVALHRPRTRPEGDPYGGDPYGGASDGDDTDAPPGPPPPASPRPRRYHPVGGLTGVLEGTVTWRGAPPPALVTACGKLAHAGVRVAANHAVAGVLVTIEQVDLGRVLPSFARAASVGGTVTKRGCELAPTIQIVTPLPAALAIHGDATATPLRVTAPAGVQPFELPPAGRVVLQAQPGVTRIEADDGSLAAAWVIASDTPYYAITDDDGRFRLDELAAGTYELTFWRAPLPTVTDGKLSYGAPVTLHRSIKIDATHPAHLDVTLAR